MANKAIIGVSIVILILLGAFFTFGGFQFSIIQGQSDHFVQIVGENNFDSCASGTSVTEPIHLGDRQISFSSVKNGEAGGGGFYIDTTITSEGQQYTLSRSGSSSAELFGGQVHVDSSFGNNCNTLSFYPNYDIDTEIIMPSTGFENQDIKAEIRIMNNFADNINAHLWTQASFATPFGESSSEPQIQVVNLKKGINSFFVDVPTSESGELTLRAQLGYTTYNRGIKLSGSLDEADGINKSTAGGFLWAIYDLRVIPDDIVEKKILLSENPIYFQPNQDCNIEGCPSEYVCQDSGLCVRSDIIEKDLPCQVLGCPVTDNKQYECSSSGVCVETIYQFLGCKEPTEDDPGVPCPNGFVCDESIGVCLNNVVATELLQCDTASDCQKPCNGIAITCDEGFCHYDGQCEEQAIGCNEVGCDQGYECNTGRNVCERTIFAQPGGLGVWLWVGIVGIIFMFMIIGIWLVRKR